MLYLVGTPIGNLEDLSIRQAKTLTTVDIVLAEDTRSATKVLQAISKLFNLKADHPRIISYYKEKEFEKLPQVIAWLEEGKKIAVISESGLPLVSDPGLLLVKSCIKRSLEFTVIPGPNAALTALMLSGFDPKHFVFVGFLPKKASEIVKLLTKLQEIKTILPGAAFVAYESSQRIQETLRLIDQRWPDARLSLSRELTKMFEQTRRGAARELIPFDYKGEITLVIS